MHSDVVQRTQIYLNDHEADLLEREASRTGASRSELIRRAIRTLYGTNTAQTRLAALQASAGAWQEHADTGAEYVDNIRGDLNDRLDRIGLQ